MPVETVLVGQAVAGEAAQTRKHLEDLIKSTNRSNFDIGELLHTIRKNNYYEGYTTFQDYVKTLDIKPRKARYLRRIAEVFEAVNVPRAQYELLGIAKCRAISSLDPTATWTNPQTNATTPMREFITGFVEQGANLTLKDIETHVRTLKGFVGERDIVWVNLPFIRSVLDNTINPTAELTRRNIGSVGKDEEGISKDATLSQCVEVWAIEYKNDPANDPTLQEAVNESEPESDE